MFKEIEQFMGKMVSLETYLTYWLHSRNNLLINNILKITTKNLIIPINQAFNPANVLLSVLIFFVSPIKFLFLCGDF